MHEVPHCMFRPAGGIGTSLPHMTEEDVEETPRAGLSTSR
jgi:hypothetical protein